MRHPDSSGKVSELEVAFFAPGSPTASVGNECSQVVAFGGPAVALSFYTQATPKSLVLGD